MNLPTPFLNENVSCRSEPFQIQSCRGGNVQMKDMQSCMMCYNGAIKCGCLKARVEM